ncbi:MAG: hypothetical protein KDB14_14260 [Planctomycetales bacterium]|nr:hypothetical protein [Planctomycetales bacterium]
MNHEVVRQLEASIEAAIAEALAEVDIELPVSPSLRTLHLMAKAAVSVYEAAVENQRQR